MKNNQVLVAAGLVLLAMVSRIVCAEALAFNFAPVVAVGLISGMLIRDTKTALVIALSGQFLADVYFQIFPTPACTGFYGTTQFFVYGGLIAAALIGRAFANVKVSSVVFGTLTASAAFFIISNFGYFAAGYNGYNLAGLQKTYVDALPFFRSSLIGDMLGSAVLFGLYSAYKFALPAKIKVA